MKVSTWAFNLACQKIPGYKTVMEKRRPVHLKRWAYVVFLSIMLLSSSISWSQVSFNGSAYTQDFQSMTATILTPATISGTTMFQISGQPGGGSVTGWYIYHNTAGTPRWGRSDGTSSTGSFFALFDGAGTPNRALGSQGSASIVAYYGIVLQNTTGATINTVDISYDAMINRNPSTTVNPYPMSYRVSAANVITSSSTADGTFNDLAGTWTAATGFTTPSSGIGAPGTQAAITPLFRIGGAAITQSLTGLSWGNNQYLYIRWQETDNSGSDASAGVDNFSFSTPLSCAVTGSATTTSSTCFGSNNGTATVTLTGTGAGAPGTYSVDGGTSVPYSTNPFTVTGLTPGNHSIVATVTAGGCVSSSIAANVGAEPVALTAASAPGTILCNGGSTTVVVSATGGTAPYTGTGSFTASAGAYSYTVTDANGCTSTTTGNISQPASVVVTATNPVIFCNGGSTIVTVAATGGTAPYTGIGTFSQSVGTVVYTVTDANGCTGSISKTITQPALLVASVTNGALNCTGTATVTVSATGGTAPYSNTGAKTITSAGTYTYTVTDANGCTSTVTSTVSPATGCPTVTEVLYPKYIQGVGNGDPSQDRKVPYACRMSINGLTANTTYRYYSRFTSTPLVGTNGSGSYILAKQSGDFTRITSASLAATGSYGTFTTDATGKATDWFIVEPTSATDFAPGTQLYWRIILNDGIASSAVAYRVTATNSVTVLGFGSGSTQGTAVRSSAITAYSAKNFVMLYNNEAGNGRPESGSFIESDGTLNGSALNGDPFTAGYAPFYGDNVDGVDKTWGTIIPNNLSTGIRNISQYTLNNGSFVNKCTSVDGVFGSATTINTTGGLTAQVITCIPVAPSLTVTGIVTNVITCFGASTGAVNITVTGGTGGAYSYSWSNGASTEDISGLAAGTYIVTVTDALGASGTNSFTVTQPTALVASSQSGTIACNGGTATVTVTATGGTAPYTGTGTFTRSAGSYSYTVTDANGCTAITSGTITQPTALVTSSQSGTIACNGGTATVTVTAVGGTAPYTGTGTFTRSAGSYSYTVTDANGCTSVTTGTITQPTTLVASSVAGTIAVPGGTTTVTITATGGTAPYTGTGTFTRGAGAYSYTVTDANGCTSVTTGTITEPGSTLIVSSTFGTISCNGGTTTVTVTATGGTAPYTGTGTFTRSAGAYSYTVTDANGATAVTTGTITQPTALVASSQSGIIACNGGTASVTVTAVGGTAPYTGTGTFTRSAGSYSYTVTDANGCTSVTTGTITQPTTLVASSVAGTIAVPGGTTTVTVTATGGTAPYTGTGTFTRGAGAYSYTVTDANGCTSVTTGTITEPGSTLIVSSTFGTISCNGGTTTVTVTATGGTAPYTGTGTFTRSAGAYSYTVTDANGATAVTTGTITQPTALVASSQSGTIACNGGTATVTVTAVGGTAPYTGTGTFTRSAGAYSYTVTDAKGCTSVTTGTIAQPAKVNCAITVSPNPTISGGALNTIYVGQGSQSVTLTVAGSGGMAPYTYNWGNLGTGNSKIVSPTVTTTYTVTVTDAKGCTSTCSVTINVIPAATCSTNPVRCNLYNLSIPSAGMNLNTIYLGYGLDYKILIASAQGGVGPYTYTWSAGTSFLGISTIRYVNPTTTTTYTLTVKDSRGCTSVCSITIRVIDVRCGNRNDKVLVCVNPNSHHRQTLCVPKSQVGNYLNAGAILGSCSQACNNCKTENGSDVVDIIEPATSVNLYPNPAHNFINIEWNAGKNDEAIVKVMDVQGKVCITKQYKELNKSGVNIKTLELNGLRKGIYVMQIISGGSSVTKRFTVL